MRTAWPNRLLPRARSLARNHAVTLTIRTHRLDADVVDSGAVHRVRIDLPIWPEKTQTDAGRLIARARAVTRGLGPGDLPDALDAEFRQHGIRVAVALDQQTAACDCRSRRRPCVHVLATVYALTQLIDERPVLTIELRSSRAEVAEPTGAGWIALSDLDPAGLYG
ncbi:SWIM zinc finger family protein [Modestobacter lapidis]|nr:hypothetical protein [Modestobacter lapidis]